VVPLYLSLLMKVMRAKGIEEGPIEQILRLYADFLADGATAKGGAASAGGIDKDGRSRLDDREMRSDVQAEVAALWPQVTTENLRALSDFAGYQREFRNLFGFDVPGVDYDLPVETDLSLV